MKQSYFDIVMEVLRKADEDGIYIYANIYPDGDNEGEEVLVIDDNKSVDKLNELFEPYVREICEKENDIFQEYSDFALDYITGDQWTYSETGFTCDECQKFYRFDNGWGGGYRNYYLGDGWVVCEDCMRESYKEDYISEMLDDPTQANTILTDRELRDMDFDPINEYPYANGMYEGENDDPVKILEKAKELYPQCEFLFSIRKDYNPFHTEFDLYKREVA